MKILVIGVGYVGLVTSACFAEMGHEVLCLDIDQQKLQLLRQGKVPFYEPGLSELVFRNCQAKRLSFTSSYEETKGFNSICFFALPSPSLPNGSCDTSYVEASLCSLAPFLKGYSLLVIKSTVSVGSTCRMKKLLQREIQQHKLSVEVDLIFSPEFLKEGNAVYDCMKPDRIVIGSDSSKATALLREIYAPFTLNHDRIFEMDILSAEMTKYAANAMLATRISFMNEIAEICKRTGANINEVRKGIGSDPRIGYSFLYAGVGYGGSCFPKDLRALIALSQHLGHEPHLLEAVETVNERQKKLLAQEMVRYFSSKGGIKGKIIAIWGLSFKPETDDMREAPSLSFIEFLQREGAILRLFDPVAMDNAKRVLKESAALHWCEDEFQTVEGADAIALITEWKQFRNVDFSRVARKMKSFAFFDGRNQYRAKEIKEKGFDYVGIGVPDMVDPTVYTEVD